MPEALARADYDFTVSEEPPPRRRARPRNTERLEPKMSRVPPMREDVRARRAIRILRACVHKPLRTILSLAGAAIVVSFVTNLLFMQDGPHPAPLFAKHEPKASEPAARRADAASARTQDPASRAVRPVTMTPGADAPAPPPAPRSAPLSVVPAAPAKPAEKTAAKQPEFDPIAQFLRTGGAQAPATTASTTAPASSETKRIAAAQRALGKVGLTVEADGVMGPGTRAAIQKFERDNKLPVTGELNPRTVKALSARASIPIP